MENRKKVSVIIPVYEVEMYLNRAIDSVLAQTLSDLEIILVDDGSTDDSPKICDQYEKEYPDQIRVIHQENQGLGMARNAGVSLATGEYIAFLDSDDTVEPDMYRSMYQKAKENDYDMVMCDVRILYVEENRTSIVSTYSKTEIDLPDYIAYGNNITYSVNKLFRRTLWEQNRYRKMLFEDIALIPAMVTRCLSIGYVPKAFYNYYRRANTLSTTQAGEMVDIIKAFRFFIDESDRSFREEVIYCAAKQIFWNMTQSRVLFQADFIGLLKEYEADFRLNPYLASDKKVRKLLDFLDREVIPETFLCVCMGHSPSEEWKDALKREFPASILLTPGEEMLLERSLPACVEKALEKGNTSFVEEYFALRLLLKHGGIVLTEQSVPNLRLKALRLNRIFFGFEDEDSLTDSCFGSVPNHYFIQALLNSYEESNIFNTALLPLKDRLRDILALQFDLKVNGRRQLLAKEIQIYLPNVLAYDMQDGENCCKKVIMQVPEGYQLVSNSTLHLWSQRILENWNLYKQIRDQKPAPAVKTPPSPIKTNTHALELLEQQWETRLQEVIDTYEQSTSWRITKPLRVLATWFRKKRGENL